MKFVAALFSSFYCWQKQIPAYYSNHTSSDDIMIGIQVLISCFESHGWIQNKVIFLDNIHKCRHWQQLQRTLHLEKLFRLILGSIKLLQFFLQESKNPICQEDDRYRACINEFHWTYVQIILPHKISSSWTIVEVEAVVIILVHICKEILLLATTKPHLTCQDVIKSTKSADAKHYAYASQWK
jgi:hypothetical protein